jgi:hypothetical protein
MASYGGSNVGQPLTTGWKAAIVIALLMAFGNTGASGLSSREQHQNHERRIDALEKQVKELRAALDAARAKAPDKGE